MSSPPPLEYNTYYHILNRGNNRGSRGAATRSMFWRLRDPQSSGRAPTDALGPAHHPGGRCLGLFSAGLVQLVV